MNRHFQTFRLPPPCAPPSPGNTSCSGRAWPPIRFASLSAFFGLRSLVAVSSVASGRIEFGSPGLAAPRFYGLSVHFQLLSTPCRHGAVTFGYPAGSSADEGLAPSVHAHSQAHNREPSPARSGHEAVGRPNAIPHHLACGRAANRDGSRSGGTRKLRPSSASPAAVTEPLPIIKYMQGVYRIGAVDCRGRLRGGPGHHPRESTFAGALGRQPQAPVLLAWGIEVAGTWNKGCFAGGIKCLALSQLTVLAANWPGPVNSGLTRLWPHSSM